MTERKTEDIAARKTRQAAEGKVAMKEYRAEEEALRLRTAKLREERLAREAAGGADVPAPAPQVVAKLAKGTKGIKLAKVTKGAKVAAGAPPAGKAKSAVRILKKKQRG